MEQTENRKTPTRNQAIMQESQSFNQMLSTVLDCAAHICNQSIDISMQQAELSFFKSIVRSRHFLSFGYAFFIPNFYSKILI